MPYRYDVHERARLVRVRFEGVVTDTDLFEYLSHMLAHTRYGAGWSTFIDMTPATEVRLTAAGIQRMRALPLYMEERLHGARAAIVAEEGSDLFEMARRYETMGASGKYPVRTFASRDEAMRWLFPDGEPE